MYESILLISGSSLFHSLIVYGEKEFLKISVLRSAASLALHAQNFASAVEKNIVPTFTIKTQLNTDPNIKVFCKPNFPVYGQNPRTYTGKYVSEKTRIFAYFTQCDVFHLLDRKRTHYWTRIIDIIL